MSWLTGVFTRTNGTYSGATVWNQDRLAGTKVTSANHDTHDQDIATGINACLNKNGENSPTANVDWGGFKITNLAVATALGQAVAYDQLLIPLVLAVGDETTAITAGTSKYTIVAPHNMTLTSFTPFISLSTAQTSGSLLTVDINVNGVSFLSTKITIENTERSSMFAPVTPVKTTSTINQNQIITIDVDVVGDGTAKGLKVYLRGRYTP